MKRLSLAFALSATAAVIAGCATDFEPEPQPRHRPQARRPAPPPPPAIAMAPQFRPQEFAWSTRPGNASITGQARTRGARAGCAGTSVALTPDTPFTRYTMRNLYGSTEAASAPVSDVRARQGARTAREDYAAYVRITQCDAQDRFTFAGLPGGSWFVIVAIKPKTGEGEAIAYLRRIETRTGRPSTVIVP